MERTSPLIEFSLAPAHGARDADDEVFVFVSAVSTASIVLAGAHKENLTQMIHKKVFVWNF